LSLLLVGMDVFIPYDKDDGILAAIHRQGIVLSISYETSGTKISCRVPQSLIKRLQKFAISS
jgi:50S ribosomal subunit-associated GTPase HflX